MNEPMKQPNYAVDLEAMQDAVLKEKLMAVEFSLEAALVTNTQNLRRAIHRIHREFEKKYPD